MNQPIVRIVRMTFHPDKVDSFLDLFDRRSEQIRSSPGCEHLELLRGARYPNVMTTISVWKTEADLDRYRGSDLFAQTWRETRTMFAASPEATTYFRSR